MKYRSFDKQSASRWGRTSIQQNFSFLTVLSGVGYALVLAVLLIIFASAAVCYTPLEESIVYWVVNIGSFVVLGVSSFITARKSGRYGLTYGVAIGGLYAMATCLIGALIYPPFIGLVSLLKRLGFSILAGGCGGVLGVNY